jgi:hypothetical protein
MNLKSIGNLVTSKAGRQVLKLQKHSPQILFVAGVIGVGATVVLACRATLKVHEVLDEHHEVKGKMVVALEDNTWDIDANRKMYTEEDYRKDHMLLMVKTAGQFIKLYGPSIILGVASIAALTGAHVVLNRRNVAVTAAYAALEKGFRDYRKRVVDKYGDGEDQEFRYGLVDHEIVEETKQGPKVVATKKFPDGITRSIYARCFDENSSSWQRAPGYNQVFIRAQQAYANDLLQARGHVFLNDVYDMLGLSRTKEGAVVGWVLGNGDDFIDFGVFGGDAFMAKQFVNGVERNVWLDFNVDGIVYDKI